jgi:hypothetical protein
MSGRYDVLRVGAYCENCLGYAADTTVRNLITNIHLRVDVDRYDPIGSVNRLVVNEAAGAENQQDRGKGATSEPHLGI